MTLVNPEESTDYSNVEVRAETYFYVLKLKYFFDGFAFYENLRTVDIKVEKQFDNPEDEDYIPNFEMRQALMISEVQNHFSTGMPARGFFGKYYRDPKMDVHVSCPHPGFKRITLDEFRVGQKTDGSNMFDEKFNYLVLGNST